MNLKVSKIKVTFRILSGGGGIVQGMTNSEFKELLAAWTSRYGQCYQLSADSYYRTLEFDTERDFVLFVKTFKPQQKHWWRNAKIEK